MSCNATEDTCGDLGMVLPIMDETTWNQNFRAFLYMFGLLWSFLGVAIIADVFMCSIEKITSKTRIIKVASQGSEEGYEEIEIKVWNDTVANLTLMALGSSAPEIMLSIIEITGNSFYSGELGPSTIVGSAAFNLLVIVAVCVMAIPSPEFRTIRAIKVFAVTAFFAVFAYVWLIIILVLISPDFVELWEAVMTFMFFPIMVILAYMADKDYCSLRKSDDPKLELGFAPVPADDSHYVPWLRRRTYTIDRHTADGSDNSEASSVYSFTITFYDSKTGRTDAKKMREFMKDTVLELRKIHPNLSEEEIAQLAAAKISEEQTHNHLWYRINATRKIGGGVKLMPTMKEELNDVYEHMKTQDEGGTGSKASLHGSMLDMSDYGKKAVIEFTATQSAILEKEGNVRVFIRRYGRTDNRVLFKLETIDGTAESNSDYIPVKTTMVFEPEETSKYMDIEIIDDNEWEPDEVFFVKLALNPDEPESKHAILGKKAIQEITIINDDEPGTFEFSKPSLLFKESAGKALIPVERSNGADGKVTITWKTEDMSAISGKDYEGGEGTLVFEHGEMSKTIEITLYDDQEVEKDECFKLDLETISPEGAKFGRIRKTIVTVVNDDDFNGMISRLVEMTNTNMDALRVESTSWRDQFRNAMNVNGGNLEGATHIDYLMHFCTFFWKIFFAIVPPVSIWGGWLTFILALGMITILTVLISDLASIFGCLIGLKDSVNAITFVALGTSLPDLFASKQAATQEKTADNCIGNVTGSNSVNVFLGLGLPWMMAAVYWTSKGDTFRVEAGTLGFSVVMYTMCALICLGLIVMRRYVKAFGPGELGGKKTLKIVSGVIMICLWVFYILVSAMQAYGHIEVSI